MKKILFALAFSISALAFAADPPNTEAPKKTELQPSLDTPLRTDDDGAKAALPKSEPLNDQHGAVGAAINKDTECLAKLHHDNGMEVEMGQLAKKYGQAKEVKKFGDLLIKDHGLADKQVMALAKKKSLDLTLPPPKDEAEKADMQAKMDGMKRLETLKGDEFDREFAKMMVEDHQKAVTLVETTLKATEDAKVQTLLHKLLPVLKEHLRIAEQINKRVQSV